MPSDLQPTEVHAEKNALQVSPVRRILFGGLFLCGLMGVAYWIAYWEWPAGEGRGTKFEGSTHETKPLPRRFRVGTFNIHGGYGLDGRLDLARTAACLQNLDFVGMNEVRGGGSGDRRSQAEQLARLLQTSWLFAPTETGWTGPQFGQGALSRSAVTRWEIVPFARKTGNGYRNFLECELPLVPPESRPQQHESLTVLITHLDRKADRQDQLRLIIERFLAISGPVILMGDLNAKRTEPQLQKLAQHPGVTDCFGQFAAEPLVSKRIDWLFVRGLNCLDANLEANEASDHPWGWADLEVPE